MTVGANNIFNVINRIADAGIFRYAFIREINFAVFVNGYIFEESITANRVVNVGFRFFVEVDNFSIATAFKIEYACVVPAVFVVADKQAFRVCGKSSFARTAQSEENCGVLAVHIGICGAVHRRNSFEREEIIHHREHSFFHFAAVPSIKNNLFFCRDVKDNSRVGI